MPRIHATKRSYRRSVSPSAIKTTKSKGTTTIQKTGGETESESGQVSTSIGTPHMPDFTSTPGLVVLVGGTLWIAVTWNDFWKPYWDSLWNGKPLTTNLDGRLIVGGIVFLIILAIMAEISPEAGGVMILLVFAMWMVFIVKGKGSGQLNAFFGWFNTKSPASGSVTGGASKPPTQVPNVGGPGATLK